MNIKFNSYRHDVGFFNERRKHPGIFILQCKFTGRGYVGCGEDIKQSLATVYRSLQCGIFHEDKNFQRDYTLYGEKDVVVSIYYTIDVENVYTMLSELL